VQRRTSPARPDNARRIDPGASFIVRSFIPVLVGLMGFAFIGIPLIFILGLGPAGVFAVFPPTVALQEWLHWRFFRIGPEIDGCRAIPSTLKHVVGWDQITDAAIEGGFFRNTLRFSLPAIGGQLSCPIGLLIIYDPRLSFPSRIRLML